MITKCIYKAYSYAYTHARAYELQNEYRPLPTQKGRQNKNVFPTLGLGDM